MIRSLYSGVSGMKNHQIRMDVVGNNISNVNTTGFKAGRTNFKDTLYQTIKNAGESTNPAQAGLGINVASINSYMTPGALQSTGRTLDLAINGNGFFKVMNGPEEYYTREGIFYLTQTGKMVNSNGYQLKGESWDKAEAYGVIGIATYDPNSPLITANGNLQLQGALSDGSIPSVTDIPLTNGMSLNQVVEAINAKKNQSGVVASIEVDTTANETRLVLTTVFDGYKTTPTLTAPTDDTGSNTILGNLGLNPPAFASYTPSNYNNDADIIVDKIPVASLNIQNDGILKGTDTNGDPLTFSGGLDVARISLFIFNNQDGLNRANDNLFEVSTSSGDANQGTAGNSGYGTIESGYLEMSNVELTDEFTNMIVTQRGYQANSRIITVSDTMLEELLNLKR